MNAWRPVYTALLAVGLTAGSHAPGALAAAVNRTPVDAGRSLIPVRTDGERYVAFEPRPGTLVVRDELIHARREIALPGSCVVSDARHGIFLVQCSRPSDEGIEGAAPFLVLPGRRELTPVLGRGTAYRANEQWTAVGKYWLQGSDSSSGKQATVYENWRTGAGRSFGDGDPGNVPRDLDSAGLRPLRPSTLLFSSRSFKLLSTRRGLAVTRARGRGQVLIDPCPCGSLQAGAGLVTWAAGKVARGYVVKTRARLRWVLGTQIDDGEQSLLQSGVQHTARHVYFNVPDQFPPRTYTIRRVRWR